MGTTRSGYSPMARGPKNTRDDPGAKSCSLSRLLAHHHCGVGLSGWHAHVRVSMERPSPADIPNVIGHHHLRCQVQASGAMSGDSALFGPRTSEDVRGLVRFRSKERCGGACGKGYCLARPLSSCSDRPNGGRERPRILRSRRQALQHPAFAWLRVLPDVAQRFPEVP